MNKSTRKHPGTSAFQLNKALFVATLFTLLTVGAGKAFAAPVPAINGYFFYLCQGATAPFFDDAPGGVWSISPATASVASVSPTGVVTGLNAGTATISYTTGGSSATAVVTVFATPGPIVGQGGICLSSSMALTDTVSGGVWSSGIPATAVVGSTGIVTANNPGAVPIYYTFTISGCFAMKTITVNATPANIGGPAAVCTGTSVTLTEGTGGGTWYSSNPASGTISTSGVLTGISGGTTTISYAATNTCKVTRVVTVDVTAVAGTITGTSNVCVTSTASLTDPAPGGIWSSGATSVASVDSNGNITGVAAGTTIISYAVTNSCGTVVAPHALAVNPLPNAGTINGSGSVCISATQSLTDTTAGGTWSASGSASVDGSGNITGLAGGTATISYAVGNICGIAYATVVVTVNTIPDPGTISGAARSCAGTTTHFTAVVPGGVWSATPGGLADASGNITGVTAGTTIVSYSLSNSCGTVSATSLMTIDPLPSAGTVTGTSVVCVGASAHLTDAVAGGIWSTTPNASIDASGNVTGVTVGTATISYTVSNACGATVASMVVTVSPVYVGSVTGPSAVNVGSTISLTDSVAGGVWSASNGNATVAANGAVTGITQGTATITYSISSVCSSAQSLKVITVNSVTGTPTSISGYYFYLCSGNTAAFFDAIPGGIWSINPLTVATVSATGVVTGVSAGTATLSYTIAGVAATATVTVYPTPGSILGSATVCQGATTSLSDLTSGGVWSSGIPSTATIGTSGVVSATNAGTVPIYYTMAATGCRTSLIVTVNANPAGISGPSRVCTGSSITLGDATAGGAWSGTNVYASVDTAGNVTGLSAGSATITYTAATGCFRSASITVNQAPAPINGTLTVCAGSRTFLSDPSSGISWTSSNTAVATISASGAVIGVSAGTSVITYNSPSYCIATSTVTVNATPVVPAIMGTSSLPYGTAGISLSDATSGGVWTSSNVAVLTVGSGTGVLSAVSTSGSANIIYTVVNGFGCSAAVAKGITVVPAPHGHRGRAETTTLEEELVQTVLQNDNENISAAAATTEEGSVIASKPMSLGLFPNPNRGMFVVKGTSGAAADAVIVYEITNAVGQVVYTHRTTAEGGVINQQIVLPEILTNGVYILNVVNGTERQAFHFAVEK